MNFKLTLKDLQTTGPLKRLMDYMKEGKTYILEIKAAKDKRSLSQNEYYFAVVVALFCQSTGYSKEEGHQFLKGMFLSYSKEVNFTGEVPHSQKFMKSTTELDTAEFEGYLEKCRLFMWHELNIHVPLPNELTEEILLTLKNVYDY